MVTAAHSSWRKRSPAPTVWALKNASLALVLVMKKQPLGTFGMVNTIGIVLPAAAAAVRHASSVSIRAEPAGHSLLPAAPDT